MLTTLRFDEERTELILLDQRRLPSETRDVVCTNLDHVVAAIQGMVVRGAPAIGIAACYGCVLAAHNLTGCAAWESVLRERFATLAHARPTAVNLSWAVAGMQEILDKAHPATAAEATDLLLRHAKACEANDRAECRAMGAYGAKLLQDGDTVLTHCNAGALATVDFGTALGVIRAAVAEGKKISVIADETRPLLQGARLTAYELACDGIPVRVACDNSCALLLQKGLVQKIIVGADRIAANGDTANKIGTFGVAVLAKHFHIPFYVAAPLSTIDRAIPDGTHIPLEERGREEVATINGKDILPKDVPVYNFAFDVTSADLIHGIITEVGVLEPPYHESIAAAFTKKAAKR